MTPQQWAALNGWAQYGGQHWVEKRSRGWAVAPIAGEPGPNKAFRSKRAAMAYVDDAMQAMARRWRGLDTPAQPKDLNAKHEASLLP